MILFIWGNSNRKKYNAFVRGKDQQFKGHSNPLLPLGLSDSLYSIFMSLYGQDRESNLLDGRMLFSKFLSSNSVYLKCIIGQGKSVSLWVFVGNKLITNLINFNTKTRRYTGIGIKM